jgi:hypothetical protein
MYSRTAYADDTYAWSREQAAALRRIAEARTGLPENIDLERVAEEIEAVGRSDLRIVEGFVEVLLRHLLQIASAPDLPAARHWAREAELQARALIKDLTRSMRQVIDIEELWYAAKARADAELDRQGVALLTALPADCPFSLDDLVGAAFDIRSAARQIRRASGQPD